MESAAWCAGIPDKDEAKVAAAIKAGTMKDSDGDGVPDHLDKDDDNDGAGGRCWVVWALACVVCVGCAWCAECDVAVAQAFLMIKRRR